MSWVKWLGRGDEPYKLFFVLLKDKQQWEEILCLITKDGSCIVDKAQILQVSRFYTELFATEGESKEILATRRDLLQNTKVVVIDEKRRDIKRVPTREEIRKVLLSMPKGKAPGIDGMTAKVLLAHWSFI